MVPFRRTWRMKNSPSSLQPLTTHAIRMLTATGILARYLDDRLVFAQVVLYRLNFQVEVVTVLPKLMVIGDHGDFHHLAAVYQRAEFHCVVHPGAKLCSAGWASSRIWASKTRTILA